MDNKQFFRILAQDLKSASLTKAQVREALLYNVEEDKETIEDVVQECFASWIPSGMIPGSKSGYDLDMESSYQSRGKRMNENKQSEKEEDVDKDEIVKTQHKKEALIRLVKEAADDLDSNGYFEQADFLDDLLHIQF